ncbi:SUPPRESSOR OF ABI3-5-like isoform X2 [Hibiscus syriacus]|uniref:SUPPRESSOR OF ABI3-5-like isoform X2 n=1 Tax=Hibiscus syriacus TaxID=106335 RepID=UPI0019225866|nr:SUPPRESSOR OF ABI3-5-like isoform X2 [Hibiscus syriacus]
MDHAPARYPPQHGWDNNSAFEGFSAVREPNFRVRGSFDEKRFLDERYSRDDTYPRSAYHRDFLERGNHPPPAASGVWSQSGRSYEEEYPRDRDSRCHRKPYVDSYRDMNTFHDHEITSCQDFDKFRDGYCGVDNFRDHEFDRPSRYGRRDREGYSYDDYDYRPHISHQRRDNSRERSYEYSRRSYDSDHERGSHRDGNWRKRESRDRDRISRERDQSPNRSCERSRSRSRGYDDHSRSRSPRVWNRRNHREDSYDDGRNEKTEKQRERGEKYQLEHYSVAPTETVVVKGLSLKTTEEDLYQILAEWGPLRHVRVIKERISGVSRGFAFIDFPSVGAARTMIDRIGDDGLVVDGRRLFFEYSKPTGSAGGPSAHDNALKLGHSNHKSTILPSDWMCTICGCVNFARRTSCFQCNEPRTDDAPAADISLSNSKRGSESGPTNVLVVRGLDENADEEMLRYEFSKCAPIKDLRLVRDKFTHVSRGFAFVHFHSVGDATKALEATNGTTLEKNGQILRVAYAKSILGPRSGTLGASQSSSLAAAAIEAAAFSQQYDAVGWTPKEYNPDDKQSSSWQEQVVGSVQQDHSAWHSGFVWDEACGYYFDAASGFYYDGNTGLYYDGNSGTWYSYDHQSQQYIPCSDQNDSVIPRKQAEPSKGSDGSSITKVIISAPAATVASVEKVASLPDAVQAAAAAALAAEKKEKEKSKEIKLASKSSILANKKKMNNVLTMWKQRSHEGQTSRLGLVDNHLSASSEDKPPSAEQHAKNKDKFDMMDMQEGNTTRSGVTTTVQAASTWGLGSPIKPRPVSNSSGGTLMGVIRGSARGLVKSDTPSSLSSSGVSTSSAVGVAEGSFSSALDPATIAPFRTDASALGSIPTTTGSGKRRFSEAPVPSTTNKDQSQTTYRDRAAERRNFYGSSSSNADYLLDDEFRNSNRDLAFKKLSSDPMPFPPGVGGGRAAVSDDVQSFEVITAKKAIDENNVGNRMLRSMGWHEGSGLGKDGSGMTEPVEAQAMDGRAGLGSRVKLDPSLEVQAGDSYKTVIHKKAVARFRQMS